MIDLYTWTTPNGYKIPILLEELGWSYNLIPVNIGKDEQFEPDFLKISPNNKIPAIVDNDTADGEPLSIFESGAILMYIADKAGRFFPSDVAGRYNVLQWLFFQVGSVGAMLGQANHFIVHAPEPIPYALDRYTKEGLRLYGVMERQLANNDFIAGDYSIADIALFPWIANYSKNVDMNKFPHVQKWHDKIASREAVQKGMSILN